MRFFIELQFLGTNYHGWQIQPDAISVQEVVQKALSTLLRETISIVGAGRTDAGVHAKQMFAHFDSEKTFNSNTLKNRLNAFLPEDISILSMFQVKDDLHARFDAISRSYEYHIYLGKNPFKTKTSWQLYQVPLNVEKMNQAAQILLQHTDFKCFSKTHTDVHTYNCNITQANWKISNNNLIFYITANRFLRNMVRAIVGTLYTIGIDKLEVDDLTKIIKSRNRSKAGFSVPAKGLFLSKVLYPFNED